MTNYHINVFYSEQDRGWIADIPDLVHCSSFGDSAQDALAQVLVAKETWIQAAEEAGKPIPKPTYRPVTAS